MRRIIGFVGLCMLAAVGCRHVGGKCDCGPTPGDAALYAPMQGYTVTPAEAIGTPKEMPKSK
jgi:hypothetical protein